MSVFGVWKVGRGRKLSYPVITAGLFLAFIVFIAVMAWLLGLSDELPWKLVPPVAFFSAAVVTFRVWRSDRAAKKGR